MSVIRQLWGKYEPLFLCISLVLLAREAQGIDVRTISGVSNPYSLALEGGYLYVANAYFFPGDTPQITVIDVSTPGEEQIVGAFSVPVFGVDIKVINGRLFLIDGYPRGSLYTRSLYEEGWTTIPLTTGNELQPAPSLFFVDGTLYVLHETRHFLDVVDVQALQVVGTIDLPVQQFRLAFAPGYLAAFAVGLRFPVCDSEGPYLSLYRFPEMELLYTVDARGDCPWNDYIAQDRINLVYDTQIRSYDLLSGELISTISTEHTYYRGTLIDGGIAIGTKPGHAIFVPPTASSICADVDLLQTEQRVSPALGWFVAPSDNRVFVANDNDNTISIIEGYDPCR